MRKILLGLTALCFLFACNNAADEKTSSTDSGKMESDKMESSSGGKKSDWAEFADEKYIDWGKKVMSQFESGNYDEWVNNFADNAVYVWSSGDSLVGKKAIADYWKNRRAKYIDSIDLSNDIWLPIKVNNPQRGPDMPGIWIISWNQVDVKYKGGKRIMFWVHNDYHLNSDDKIDRYVSYVDRAAINAAMKP